MPSGFKYRILVADNDSDSLSRVCEALSQEGYVVLSAHDGFEALAELGSSIPEIVVADLELPRMSGFELLAVVRRRFPAVGVIARSEEFFAAGMPEGLLTDRFVRKGINSEFELIETVRQLLSVVPLRTALPKVGTAPAWLPRTAQGYIVITCLNCLRSSSLRYFRREVGVIQEATCPHCDAQVHYRLDRTTAPSPNEPSALKRALATHQQTRATAEFSKESIKISQDAIEHSKARIQKNKK